jgi:histidine triad (HIT) family protein
MENCVFCKIVKGEIPSHKIYEGGDFMAFLDIRPLSPGHALVIPKQHYRWVWDVPNAGAYFEVARKIALAQKKAFNTDYVISKIMGEEVHHAHIWIYPDSSSEIIGDKNDFVSNVEKIKKNL